MYNYCLYFSAPVNSYRLVKSTSPNNIIDENGLVLTTAVSVDADLIGGSLAPLAPGSTQTVTINLRRPTGPQSPPLYFTLLLKEGATLPSFINVVDHQGTLAEVIMVHTDQIGFET